MSATAVLDHLIVGIADLEGGIRWFEQRTGVTAAIGGVHPGRGTRNALLSLGARQYLEILAPDPAQTGGDPGLAALRQPRLVGWAAVTHDAGETARRMAASGMKVIGPRAGARARPDGRQLKWSTVSIETFARGEVDPVPFFIEWAADSPHPSQDSPPAGSLLTLTFEHPDAAALRDTLARAGISATVASAPEPRLLAVLQTAKGQLSLS